MRGRYVEIHTDMYIDMHPINTDMYCIFSFIYLYLKK